MTELVRCVCSRLNNAWRSYCGGCGSALQPRCDCGFVNGKSDCFCGGCGGAMVSAIRGSSSSLRASDSLRASNANESTIPLDIIKDALSGEPL
ncbi:MAG TPA: hypothetical protein VM509_00975 [Planctomycetota bacterium]|nr:hypothetical protein [Planctomycetota bacterium]